MGTLTPAGEDEAAKSAVESAIDSILSVKQEHFHKKSDPKRSARGSTEYTPTRTVHCD